MKLALVTLLENPFLYPPLGLLRMGSYIKKMRKDINVRIIDRTFENPELEMEKFKPDIMGIVLYTTYYTEDINFCKKMKQRYPNLIIIGGGPQITTLQIQCTMFLIMVLWARER